MLDYEYLKVKRVQYEICGMCNIIYGREVWGEVDIYGLWHVQVHEAMCAAERAHTEEMLRKDPQFQEDMATPAVRSVVDSVVADPAMGPYVTVCPSPYLKQSFD